MDKEIVVQNPASENILKGHYPLVHLVLKNRNMSLKPFRNSKGVNKPFRSPFSNTSQTNSVKDDNNTPDSNICRTPVKSSVSKKLHFTNTPSPKKLCLTKENHVYIEENKVLYHEDLEILRKKVQEKQESINNLKRTLSYKKKNRAEDLEIAIQKWTNCCKIALKDYQSDLQEKSGQSVTISEILSSLNINPDKVHYFIDDDTFY